MRGVLHTVGVPVPEGGPHAPCLHLQAHTAPAMHLRDGPAGTRCMVFPVALDCLKVSCLSVRDIRGFPTILGVRTPDWGTDVGCCATVLLCYLSMSGEEGVGGVGGDSCRFPYSWPLTSVEKSDSDPSVGSPQHNPYTTSWLRIDCTQHTHTP